MNGSGARFGSGFAAGLAPDGIGEKIHAFAADIYPICRSITGDGVRQTLAAMMGLVPLDVHEVASGTQVFDWTVPREWNIRAAYIKDSQGRVVVDLANHALHVVSYSVPVKARMPLAELKRHIHTLPLQPELIPYRTSYYAESWGFCMAHRLFESLADGDYEVLIDSTLADGALTHGEYLHKGRSEREVLLWAHACHPALANDNCSGLSLLAHLAHGMKGADTRLSYRFVFAPGTIGAIAWLARNEATIGRVDHGLVVSCAGDGGGPVYKRSRRGDAKIDRAMAHVLGQGFPQSEIQDFSPYGYDERQFCSPGFNMPVGLIQRSQYGTFPQYHTSADNLDFIRPEHLEQSYRMIVDAIDILEHDCTLVSLNPKCEPQLGRRGLYGSLGGDKEQASKNMAMLWVLNLADGAHTMLDIAERARMPFALIRDTAARLAEHGLVVAGV
jgi:aminopeptidase-like protein